MKTTKKPWYKQTWFIVIAVVLSPFLLWITIALSPILLLLSPWLIFLMWKKTNWSKKIKVTVTTFVWVVILVLIIGIIAGASNSKEMYSMQEVAQNYLKEWKIEEAKKIILESKQKFNISSNPAIKLEEDINKLESEEFLKKSLIEMTNTEIELLKTKELKTIFIENESMNSLFLKKLDENLNLRQGFLEEVEKNKQLAQKIKKEQELIENQNKLTELKIKAQEERKAKIEKQFSAWDGKHITFSRMIQENLKDPDSFKHVETRYEDKGEYILVAMKYRWTNSFWAVMTEYATGKFTIDGEFIGLVK